MFQKISYRNITICLILLLILILFFVYRKSYYDKVIYRTDNKIKNIKNLLNSLKGKYGDYSFISYIDGEYGIRVHVYNSLCYDFYKKCKQNNKTVVGICFKGTKSFLRNCSDHIIEIQDIAFNSTKKEIVDNSRYSANHKNDGYVAKNLYEGKDGWSLEYIRGLHCDEYENMLEEINFKNIFYTLHCDGSRYINKKGVALVSNNLIPYKINNTEFYIPSIQSWIDNNLFIEEKEYNPYTNNAVAIWIRNTNKWPERNMSPHIYNSVFDFCIKNKKTCYVFQDLQPVKIPDNEYIIDSTIRYKNRPNFDKFLDICNKCDYFIGADSGSTEFILVHSKTSVKYTAINISMQSMINKRMNKNDSILHLDNL